MIYRLFKRYMLRLINEYAKAYDIESRASGNTDMRTDVYWLQKYLLDEFEWTEDKDGNYVRRTK